MKRKGWDTWKSVERRICRQLGGQRNPLSGANSRHTSGDIIHDSLYVEIKHRKKIPFYKTFKETVKEAKKEKKIPMVVFHEKGSHDSIVMIKLKDLKEMIE